MELYVLDFNKSTTKTIVQKLYKFISKQDMKGYEDSNISCKELSVVRISHYPMCSPLYKE